MVKKLKRFKVTDKFLLDEIEMESIFTDQEKYIGQTARGLKDGSGIWTNGQEYYEGYWENDNFHGEGRYVSIDGDIMQGCFYAGKLHGFGKLQISQQKMQYKGEFKHGEFDGHGEYR